MGYVLIIANASFWDTEEDYFKEIEKAIKKNGIGIYYTFNEEHKRLYLINYSETQDSQTILNFLKKFNPIFKKINRKYKNYSGMIEVLGEAITLM